MRLVATLAGCIHELKLSGYVSERRGSSRRAGPISPIRSSSPCRVAPALGAIPKCLPCTILLDSSAITLYMRPDDAYTGLLLSAAAPRRVHSPKLTRAAAYLADQLEANNKPVLPHFHFFQIVLNMYRDSSGEKLYLRRQVPDSDDISRLRKILKAVGAIGNDRDYGSRIVRVLTVSDLPAEDIVCLVDPTCYVSHLSAMQRWGLTDRTPRVLALTRPDRATSIAALRNYMSDALNGDEVNPYPLRLIQHPYRVRRRSVALYESKTADQFIAIRGTNVRLSTIGQTFLDTLQRPDLCGGMGPCSGCMGRACVNLS